MYILYETYGDNARLLKDVRINTKILGVYNDKKSGLNAIDKIVKKTIFNMLDKNNWYYKKYDKKLLDNEKDVIKAYEIFNDFIDNCEEEYLIILEKVEVINNGV